jgi:hypothetical protein
MSHSKHGLRALGLCLLAALGLTAFAAASAQAQTGWLEVVNGTQGFIAATKKIHAVIHPLVGGAKHAVLDTTVGVNNEPVQKLCETLTTEDGLIFAGAAATGLITLKFTNCKTFINGIENKPCKPLEPIVAKTKFKAILHTGAGNDGKTYILFEPHTAGTPFTTIELHECLLGEKVPITGDLVAECLNSSLAKNTAGTDFCLDDTAHHYIQEAPHKLFELGAGTGKFHELKFGIRLALLLGIADVLLTDSANPWAVHI